MTNFKCPECGKSMLPKGEFIVRCPQCSTVFEWFAWRKDRKGDTLAIRLERWLGYKWIPIRI